ncbi:preprotein translocase subunit SecY [Candidatus Dojkabacteria bacterium]|uniref:Protein translocase subunit SecY n=1 Tax=Candidatus Dojkabacteria bacterium TaxID=2099670 RepID=A0A955HYJ8_9BACT|nr:preprotein translocase subunit SecY [Candidatus Dojkabacteria bacterium]MCB9790791.1 preprotein translocase subunit SecY [Candidatus Nomurabacteria bacterium]
MKKLLEAVLSVLRSKEIRDRIYFSLLILVVFRVLAAVPVVGIPFDAIKNLFGGTNFGQTVSEISGGVLETASVVAIGLTPYINASIILQLLGTVIPKLDELQKEGSQGRRLISMYTRYLTVPLAIMQSFLIYSSLRGLNLMPQLSGITLVAMVSTLTGGAMLMMWFGELVTESGIGNGSSYLIFLGIVAGIPNVISNNLRTADPLQLLWFVFLLVVIIAIVIFISEGERRVKVTYSRRVHSAGAQDNYVPIKVTQFGVLPVIFAVSLLSFPQFIAQFLATRDINSQVTNISNQIITFLNDTNVHNIGTFLLVVAFSFFYITVVFKPDDVAENLGKRGAFIQGIRPGKQTAQYLKHVAFRLTAIGSVFLGVLAILPSVLVATNVLPAQILSGTGLLILVGVALDMKRQIDSMVVIRSYERYI